MLTVPYTLIHGLCLLSHLLLQGAFSLGSIEKKQLAGLRSKQCVQCDDYFKPNRLNYWAKHSRCVPGLDGGFPTFSNPCYLIRNRNESCYFKDIFEDFFALISEGQNFSIIWYSLLYCSGLPLLTMCGSLSGSLKENNHGSCLSIMLVQKMNLFTVFLQSPPHSPRFSSDA